MILVGRFVYLLFSEMLICLGRLSYFYYLFPHQVLSPRSPPDYFIFNSGFYSKTQTRKKTWCVLPVQYEPEHLLFI